MRYDIRQGDLEPALQQELTGVSSIHSATVTFVMVQVKGSKQISAAAVIDDPDKCIVHYAWQAGDTDVPGVYRALWRVTYPSSRPESFPSDEPLYVVIHPSLAA